MHTEYPETLSAWLERIEACHPAEIEMGLERIRTVAERLSIDVSASRTVVVAGTNGKGSTTAMLDAILRQAGLSTGVYTSPHFLRYNERIRISGEEVEDVVLCRQFELIEQARGEIALTYFEYGTLAALLCFSEAQPDVVILEVGLGGRLDAVNIIDADVAVLTTVALDHTDWLGDDREQIGREKAGIFRAGRPAVCGEANPPHSVLDVAAEIGANLLQRGVDFTFSIEGDRWNWSGQDVEGQPVTFTSLPNPSLPLVNAASVLQVVQLLNLPALSDPEVMRQAVDAGLSGAQMTGRMQQLVLPEGNCILDVAHNAESATYLASWLDAHPVAGQTRLLIGMLADKDITAVIDALKPSVDCWYPVSLPGKRGASVEELVKILADRGVVPSGTSASVAEGLAGVRQEMAPGDRLVVAGSFVTVTEALMSLQLDG